MTHFTDDELIDLVDGALPPERRAHLQDCEACRARAGAIESVLALAVGSNIADVPEPSPLFWDHLSARVRDAVAEPSVPTWRDRISWPASAWAAGLAAIVLAVTVAYPMLSRTAPTPLPAVVRTAPAAPETVLASTEQPADDIEADEAWALVRSVADQIEWDDAHDAGIATRPDAAERMTLELSTREQSELARLLHRELQRSGT